MAHETSKRSKRSDWLDRLARHRSGLAALSFAESTVLPIPLETVAVPLMVGAPKRALTIALAIWLGCLVGASLFYFVGLFLFDPVVEPVLGRLELADDFAQMTKKLNEESLFWAVFLVSFSPAPMQLAALGAGAAQGNFLVYIAAIAASRGLRYFGLAIVAQFVGTRIVHLRLPKRILVPGLMATLLAVWGVYRLL